MYTVRAYVLVSSLFLLIIFIDHEEAKGRDEQQFQSKEGEETVSFDGSQLVP